MTLILSNKWQWPTFLVNYVSQIDCKRERKRKTIQLRWKPEYKCTISAARFGHKTKPNERRIRINGALLVVRKMPNQSLLGSGCCYVKHAVPKLVSATLNEMHNVTANYRPLSIIVSSYLDIDSSELDFYFIVCNSTPFSSAFVLDTFLWWCCRLRSVSLCCSEWFTVSMPHIQ